MASGKEVLAGSSVAVASLFLSKQKYHAVAQVQVFTPSHMKGEQADVGGLNALMGSSPEHGDYYFKSKCVLLESQQVLDKAARRLNMEGTHWANTTQGNASVRSRLKVQPEPTSQMIKIVGVADSGMEAAAVANQTMAAFVEVSAEMEDTASIQISGCCTTCAT